MNHREAHLVCSMNCFPRSAKGCDDCWPVAAVPAMVHQSDHVAWMCPNDPDVATAFVWAKPGMAPPRCACCGAVRVAVSIKRTHE
jgi:hypothetical protein